jgi:hypothetical protein
MEPIGRFLGGKVVVKCSGFQCPEYGIEREYVGVPIDLQEVVAGDMDAPLERESAELTQEAAPALETPPAEVPDAVV